MKPKIPEHLLYKERKNLLKRVSNAVGDRIRELNRMGYSGKDIFEVYGLHESRQSEFKHYRGGGISLTNLTRVIREELMTVDEIIAKVGANDREKKFLNGFRRYENKRLWALIKELGDMGIEPTDILEDYKRRLERQSKFSVK